MDAKRALEEARGDLEEAEKIKINYGSVEPALASANKLARPARLPIGGQAGKSSKNE